MPSVGKSIQGVVSCGLLDFPPLLGGGLEPHFRVLFSAIFHAFPCGISIRVETSGSERKQKCGKLWSIYVQSCYVF